MSGLVVSSQISLDFIRLPENGTVKLQFNLVSTNCRSIMSIIIMLLLT